MRTTLRYCAAFLAALGAIGSVSAQGQGGLNPKDVFRDCADICPEECIELVDLRRLQAEPEVWQELEQEYGGPLRHSDGAPLAAALMIKDEQRCIRCGLCALRCPVDCITMESFSLERRP